MPEVKTKTISKVGFTMVFLMVLLQAAYAIYAYIDPQAFALVRGTELFNASDSDWVNIYASRTIFVALIIGYLLFLREYKILVWAALFGTVMPVTDAWLAFHAGAENPVIYKHIATIIYLLATSLVLKLMIKDENSNV
jgi:hypothetical protein